MEKEQHKIEIDNVEKLLYWLNFEIRSELDYYMTMSSDHGRIDGGHVPMPFNNNGQLILSRIVIPRFNKLRDILQNFKENWNGKEGN